MTYPRIFSALRAARWAACPATVQAVFQTLSWRLSSENGTPPTLDAEPPSKPSKASAITVIPIHGIIGKNLSQLETACGGVDVNAIKGFIESAIEDDRCDCIVLDIDSPGGVVTGVPEVAAFIREASQEKPIYAFSSGQMCSAAYWLASSTQGIFCTMTAEIGSIGVYVALVDESAAWAQNGYKLELIKAGDFKAMGHPGQALGSDARALIQSDVDKIYSMFTADVLKSRPDIGSSVMQGQTFMGDDAVKAGLVDGMVGGLKELIGQLTSLAA